LAAGASPPPGFQSDRQPKTRRPARLPRGGRATGMHPPRADRCRAGQASQTLRTPWMSPGHSAPAAQAHAPIPFRQLPAAVFPGAAYAFGELADRDRDDRPTARLSLADPKDRAHSSPTSKMMHSAENIGNFPLNALRPGHAVGGARPQDAQGAGSEPGQGVAPAAPSPPAV